MIPIGDDFNKRCRRRGLLVFAESFGSIRASEEYEYRHLRELFSRNNARFMTCMSRKVYRLKVTLQAKGGHNEIRMIGSGPTWRASHTSGQSYEIVPSLHHSRLVPTSC